MIALAFALLGQFYFTFRREYVWDGALFWGVAIVALGLLLGRLRRLERGPTHWRPFAWVKERPLHTLAVVGGLGLSLLPGLLARQRPAEAGFGDLLWLWLIGVVWYLLAFIPESRLANLRRGILADLQAHSLELIALAALLLIAFVVRGYDLAHIPANLGGDEGTQGVVALELIEGPLGNPFSTGWYSVPTMSFLAYGLSMRLFGATVTGLRMLSALIGTATVLTTFLLARELWGTTLGQVRGQGVAWLAAAALTVSHFHVHFSRLGSNQIADGFFMTLAFWLLARALRSATPSRTGAEAGHSARAALYFALAGAAMGLGWYGYFGARLVGIVAAAYLGWRAVTEYRFLARYGRYLLILVGAALVVLMPLLLHYVARPDTLASRFNQVSIFASGWLEREQEITGRSAVSLLLQQFWKSVSAFNYTLDPTFWYHPAIPLLDFISGLLFVLGLVWTMAHWRRPSNGLLLIWFWLALILGWVLTENPPSSMRMTVVAPALAIFVGLGLSRLAYVLRLSLDVSHLSSDALRFIPYLLLIPIAVLNLAYYFRVYTPTRIYGNPTAEVATELGRQLARRDEPCFVYFHAPPHMYWSFGTLRFLARETEGVDVPPPGEGEALDLEPLVDLRPDQAACFVFLPERQEELERARALRPGGDLTAVRSEADGRLLYVLYAVGRQ